MKKLLMFSLLCSVSLLPAFALAATGSEDGKKVVAEVNGKNISRAEVDKVLARMAMAQRVQDVPSYDALKEEEKMAVVRQVAAQKLLDEEVEKSKIEKEKEVKERITQIEKELLQNEFLSRKAKESVTDAAVKARYEKLVADSKGKEEFRVRHILVDKEEDAKKVAAELAKKPAAFAEVAKKNSKDSSAKNGGDLGYVVTGSLMKEFETAALALKKGEMSKPVKTQVGWHIIRLEDRRAVVVPPFEQIKGKIQQALAEKAVQDYLAELTDKAKIELAKK